MSYNQAYKPSADTEVTMDVDSQTDYIIDNLTKNQQKQVVRGILVNLNRYKSRSGMTHGIDAEEFAKRMLALMNNATDMAVLAVKLNQAAD